MGSMVPYKNQYENKIKVIKRHGIWQDKPFLSFLCRQPSPRVHRECNPSDSLSRDGYIWYLKKKRLGYKYIYSFRESWAGVITYYFTTNKAESSQVNNSSAYFNRWKVKVWKIMLIHILLKIHTLFIHFIMLRAVTPG